MRAVAALCSELSVAIVLGSPEVKVVGPKNLARLTTTKLHDSRLVIGNEGMNDGIVEILVEEHSEPTDENTPAHVPSSVNTPGDEGVDDSIVEIERHNEHAGGQPIM